MRKFDLKMNLVGLLSLLMLWGSWTPAVADEVPALSELIGRYRLTGECTVDEGMQVPATTDYDVAIFPGSEEGTVQINGLLGYGGGIVASYDSETGALTCTQEGAYLCATVDGTYSNGEYVVLDAGMGGSLDLNFTVTKGAEGIVISTTSPLSAILMLQGGSAGYANGFTLTKEAVSVPASSVTGTYAFTASSDVISNLIDDAEENFTLTIADAGNGKLTVSGLFGLSEATVEATYYEEGGLIVLPFQAQFTDELFMGNDEDNGIMSFEPAPYFFVNGNELTSPSSFILRGGIDWDMFLPLDFSFIGGRAVKKGANAIASVVGEQSARIVVEGGVLTVTTPVAGTIVVYDVQGRVVASATGTTASFSSLPTGLYVVKAGTTSRKVVL